MKNKIKLGRGFIVYFENKNLRITLNLPTTNNDIEDYYEFVEKACQYFKVTEFIQDENNEKLFNILQLKNDVKIFNYNYLKSFLKEHTNVIIYGVENPLYMPENIREKLIKLSDESLDKVFSDYLHEKQNLVLFYMKPMFYEKDGEIMAVYPLTENVDYIVPKKAFIPYLATEYMNGSEPNRWVLSIIFENSQKDIMHLEFNNFTNYLTNLKLDEYDDKHWILKNVNNDFIDKLLNS